MKALRRPLLAFFLALFGALAAGCSTQGPKQSSIPWSRPQTWEGQIPGMGQPTGR